jgi:2-haloacid dehalogenase
MPETKELAGAVFDLGNVLIEWNPRRLYRQIFESEEQVEWFLQNVCTHEWNRQQDRGRSWEEGIEEACARHPDWRPQIEAYHQRWEETMGGAIEGTVAILAELKAVGLPVFALTNWSAETYPRAEARFSFLSLFDEIIVSGREGLAKPEPEIFQLMAQRAGLPLESLVFIDDSQRNIDAAAGLGMTALRFAGPERLREELKALGLPLS